MEMFLEPQTKILVFATFAGILLDVISGVAQAVKNKELSSEVMRLGLWHKCGFVGLMVLGAYVEWVQGITDISAAIGFTIPTLAAICVYIIGTEVVSIIENLKQMNPEILEALPREGSNHD